MNCLWLKRPVGNSLGSWEVSTWNIEQFLRQKTLLRYLWHRNGTGLRMTIKRRHRKRAQEEKMVSAGPGWDGQNLWVKLGTRLHAGASCCSSPSVVVTVGKGLGSASRHVVTCIFRFKKGNLSWWKMGFEKNSLKKCFFFLFYFFFSFPQINQ